MPSPKSKTSQSTVTKTIEMDFPDAIREVIAGKKLSRLSWPNYKNVYMCLEEYRLKIKLEDGVLHELIVSDGDMFGTDWVVI